MADTAACIPAEVASVPVRYTGADLAPAIGGAINGKPATMLVDTGAFMSHLTMNGANRHRLALRPTPRRVHGIGGTSAVYMAEVREFVVGPARATRRQELDVIAEADTTPAFDAIVGVPFLLQMDLEFDLGAKRMRFLARDCAMRAALDQLPADRFGPLWLYLARVRNDVPGLGKRELEDSLALQGKEDWPRPIADFYLGRLDEAGLLAAGSDTHGARNRSCQARTYITEWHAARGDTARADALKTAARTDCTTPASAATNQDTSTR